MEAFPKGQEAGTVTSGRKPVPVFLLSCCLSLAVRFRFQGDRGCSQEASL